MPATGHIERHDAPSGFTVGVVDVVAHQQGHRHQTLHGRREIAAHQSREPIGLTVEGQRHTFELFVMLQLDGVQPREFDGDGGGSSDTGRGVVVGDLHLVDIAVGDVVALSGAPVTGDQHSAAVRERHDGGAVRQIRDHVA